MLAGGLPEIMPDASSAIRKTVRLLVRFSQAFDRRFLPAHFAVDSNQDFVHRLYRSHLFSGATVVEVGGGKNPLISVSEKKDLGLRVIGLISALMN